MRGVSDGEEVQGQTERGGAAGIEGNGVERGAAAYRQTHARILLLSDEGQGDGVMKDGDIARSLQVGRATVERVRRRCVAEGVERALGRKEQLNRGRSGWTVRGKPI